MREIKHFAKCPITHIQCPFCCFENEYWCGLGTKTKKGIVNKIKEMKVCPKED